MKGITTGFTEEVRAANPIQDVLPEFVPDFPGFDETVPSELKCPCPLPQGGHAGFAVYVDDQSYRCSGCARWGDVFDLVRELKGVDFIQARNMLADRAGILKPALPQPDAPSELELRAMGDVLEATVDLYHKALVQDRARLEEVVEKVAQDEASVMKLKLGWAQGANLAQYLAGKGFDIELAKKAGVLREDGSDFFQNRVTIPVHSRGRVVFMTGKALEKSTWPTYLDLPPNELVKGLPLRSVAEGDKGELVIVLSFGDLMALVDWSVNCLFVPRGTLPEQWLPLLAGRDPIYICFIPDAFGDALALGKRITKGIGIMPYLVPAATHGRDLYESAKGPLRCSKDQFRSLLNKSPDLVDSMLGRIAALNGARRADEVEGLFRFMATLAEFDLPQYRRKVVKGLGITRGQFAAHLKEARGEEERAAGIGAEDIDEGACLAIHPALDYLEQIGVVSVALDMKIDNRVVTRPYLITSDRQRLEPYGRGLEIRGQRVLFRSEPKAPCEKRWRKADIDRFLDGDDPDPGQTFSRLLGIVRRHIDFRDPVEAEILAIWCMASYLFPLFTSYPYLHLYGFKGTGKTQTMRLASKLAFNMVLASGITPSATFRLVQSSRCCVGLDEAENLRGARDRDSRELLGLLRAGCKKGAAAIRAEAVPDKGLMAIQYDVYSPKMIASIDPIEDILGSRCISINMLRTENPEIGRVELSDNGEDWAGMRHELYCFALGHFPEVRQLYADEASLRILLNRDHELWLPLFSVAKLLDERGADGVLDRLVEYAREASAEGSDSGLEEFDLALMEVLVSLVGKDGAEAKWIAAKEMEGQLRQVLAGSHLPRDVPQSVGYSLKNLGLLHSPRSKKRTATGVMYYIQPGQLTSVCDRWGIEAPTEPAAEEAAPVSVTGSGTQPGRIRSKTHRANHQ